MSIEFKDIPFFQGLSKQELTAVQGCLREKTFRKGESLFVEGNLCDRIFFVRSGRVNMYRLGPSGRGQILETLQPGDTCACHPGSTQDWHCASSAEAVTDCSVWFLSRENYIRLVNSHHALALSLNRLFAQRLQCFSALIEEVSLKDTQKRLVKFLLDMFRSAGGRSLTLPFTREELAQRIGTTRETVTRHLHALKRKKLIDIKPHQIVILDKEGLQKLF
jgi:CRP-like cAMP-binding protein